MCVKCNTSCECTCLVNLTHVVPCCSYPAIQCYSYPHCIPSLHPPSITHHASAIKQPLQVLPNAHHASVNHSPIKYNHHPFVTRPFVALRPFRLRVHRLTQRTLTDTATNCVVLACLSLFSIRSLLQRSMHQRALTQRATMRNLSRNHAAPSQRATMPPYRASAIRTHAPLRNHEHATLAP